MEFIELLLIFLGVVAFLIASVSVIITISSFYRMRFGFSIWSGIIILLFAFVLLLPGIYNNSTGNSIIVVISFALCIFTGIRDIRLSGFLYGIAGFLFQILMTFLLFFVIILILSGMLARAITRSTRHLTGTYSNVLQEMHYAVILFPVFIKK